MEKNQIHELIEVAMTMEGRAYAPYSHFPSVQLCSVQMASSMAGPTSKTVRTAYLCVQNGMPFPCHWSGVPVFSGDCYYEQFW